MHTLYYIVLVVSTVLFSSLVLAGAYLLLSRLPFLDNPNERSNHATPVPTGAGLAFIISALAFLLVANAPGNILLPAFLLCLLSFVDDVSSLSVLKRLAAQAIAVTVAITAIDGPVFQGLLPLWADRIVVGLIWMWFINLYNFMDGIDGISVGETVSVGIGLTLLGFYVPDVPRSIAIDAVIVVAAVAAFYPWNRHPAKLFMGDAGSIPLGFIIGFLLFNLAAAGYWAAALILPAYYLADASVTIVRRLFSGKPVWQAHSEHFYQKAVRAGRAHDQVVSKIVTLNVLLIVLALVSTMDEMSAYISLGIAYAATFVLLHRFITPARAMSHEVAHTA